MNPIADLWQTHGVSIIRRRHPTSDVVLIWELGEQIEGLKFCHRVVSGHLGMLESRTRGGL